MYSKFEHLLCIAKFATCLVPQSGRKFEHQHSQRAQKFGLSKLDLDLANAD